MRHRETRGELRRPVESLPDTATDDNMAYEIYPAVHGGGGNR